VLAFIATLLGAPATPASAKPTEQWGFAYNDRPNPGLNYVMPIDRQWGTWKTYFPADWATVSQVATGTYRVRFPHVAGKGVVHVTAVNGGPVSCHTGGWKPGGVDEYVDVRCFAPGGYMKDSAFTVLYAEKFGLGGAPYGWLHSKATGGTNNYYNSSGGVNTSGHGGIGVYKAYLPGLGTGYDGNIQVTAVHTKGVRCKVAKWLPTTGGHVVYVYCHDTSGTPVDSEWTLTYHHKLSVFGGSPKLFAYLWDTLGAIPPGANVNSQGGINSVVSAGLGQRMVRFPKVGLYETHVQVTADGPNASFCNLLAPWVVYSMEVIVRDVACYAPTGAPSNERSFVTYTSRY
jgi:hypothetical protein